MDRYVGLDVHAASTTMAVVGPTGRRIRSRVLDTSAGPLVEALRGIGGERHVCLEEGTQSSWLYEVLEPHAAEVVVVGAFTQRGSKSDEKDAYWLAEQLRIGAVERRGFKDVGAFRQLRELSRVHTMVVRDAVQPMRRQAGKAMVSESHRHPISEVLESCPGLGPIRAAQLLPVVVSPWRFRTKRQSWSYCGLVS